jgi:hypothetical protein
MPSRSGPSFKVHNSKNKKPHLSFKKWGFKISLPYLPSEQGNWRAYFCGDNTRMGGDVNSKSQGVMLDDLPETISKFLHYFVDKVFHYDTL